MVSNKLTHRRTTISNPKICKSKLKPLRPLQPEPPPQWPPPSIRATLRCTGPSEQAERDLILYPDNPHTPTHYDGYSADGDAYASVRFQLGPAKSIITPYIVWLYSDYADWSALIGDAYEIPNIAFAFFNINWRWQAPSDAEIKLFLAYP